MAELCRLPGRPTCVAALAACRASARTFATPLLRHPPAPCAFAHPLPAAPTAPLGSVDRALTANPGLCWRSGPILKDLYLRMRFVPHQEAWESGGQRRSRPGCHPGDPRSKNRLPEVSNVGN